MPSRMEIEMKIHEKITDKLFRHHGYMGGHWLMSFAEKFAISGILSHRRPVVSLEIGSLEGGSLSVASKYSERVISIDPNPDVKARLADRFDNVEFITGYSQEELPGVIQGLNDRQEDLGYVLIDGDHTEEGVRKDIEEVLKFQPKSPLWILMHDSFNPGCRKGIKSIDWAANPHVHWVNYDFVPGFLNSVPGVVDEMWGGLALAYFEATPREGKLMYGELLGRQFDKLFPLSAHAERKAAS